LLGPHDKRTIASGIASILPLVISTSIRVAAQIHSDRNCMQTFRDDIAATETLRIEGILKIELQAFDVSTLERLRSQCRTDANNQSPR
jgi:hypothetical protein